MTWPELRPTARDQEAHDFVRQYEAAHRERLARLFLIPPTGRRKCATFGKGAPEATTPPERSNTETTGSLGDAKQS
jgi:hypothetical protein